MLGENKDTAAILQFDDEPVFYRKKGQEPEVIPCRAELINRYY